MAKLVSIVPGQLNAPEENIQILNIALEELKVREIIHFAPALDYLAPTSAPHPLVYSTPAGSFCIEGHELVMAACDAGKESVVCNVTYVNQHSDIYLLLQKKASREKTQGGASYYPEKLLGIVIIESERRKQGEDITRFIRGGARRGEDFEKAQHNSILWWMINELYMPYHTAVKQIAHADGLTVEALKALSAECDRLVRKADLTAKPIKPGKGFFTKIQPSKRKLLDDLRASRTPEHEIAKKVSVQVFEWWDQYKANGNIIVEKKSSSASQKESCPAIKDQPAEIERIAAADGYEVDTDSSDKEEAFDANLLQTEAPESSQEESNPDGDLASVRAAALASAQTIAVILSTEVISAENLSEIRVALESLTQKVCELQDLVCPPGLESASVRMEV